MTALADMLEGHASNRQSAWTALRQRSALTTLPPNFDDVVAEVVRFVDPLVERGDGAGTWLPPEGHWTTERNFRRPLQ